MEYVELSTDKLYGLTQHRVRLVVTVCLQEGGHYVHKPSINDINVLKQVFTNAHVIYILKRCIFAHTCISYTGTSFNIYAVPVHVS